MATLEITDAVVARTRDFVGSKIGLEVSRNRADAEIIGMAVSYRTRSEVAICASIHGRQVRSCHLSHLVLFGEGSPCFAHMSLVAIVEMAFGMLS